MAYILVIEDDQDNQEVISRMIQLSGHTVTIANNGQDGLNKLAEKRPDLILMDMSMPEIDGWTATRMIKNNPLLAAIPIIAVTSHAMTDDAKRAISVGCDDYMSKPIDFFKLKDMVDQHLQRVSS